MNPAPTLLDESITWTFVFAVIAIAAAGHLAATLARAWRDSSTRLDRDLARLNADIDRDRIRTVEDHRRNAA